MKKKLLIVTLMAIAALTGCGGKAATTLSTGENATQSGTPAQKNEYSKEAELEEKALYSYQDKIDDVLDEVKKEVAKMASHDDMDAILAANESAVKESFISAFKAAYKEPDASGAANGEGEEAGMAAAKEVIMSHIDIFGPVIFTEKRQTQIDKELSNIRYYRDSTDEQFKSEARKTFFSVLEYNDEYDHNKSVGIKMYLNWDIGLETATAFIEEHKAAKIAEWRNTMPGVVEQDWTKSENIIALGDIIMSMPNLEAFKEYFMQYGEPSLVKDDLCHDFGDQCDAFSQDGVQWDLSDDTYYVTVTYDPNNLQSKTCKVVFEPISGESSSDYLRSIAAHYIDTIENCRPHEGPDHLYAGVPGMVGVRNEFVASYCDKDEERRTPTYLQLRLELDWMFRIENE